jgi:hypothetical protein
MNSVKNITVIAIFIFAVSCKKEKQNNPAIIYTSINKTLTIATANEKFDLDINNDEIKDIRFVTNNLRYNNGDLSNVDNIFITPLTDSIEIVDRQLSIPWKNNSYSFFVVFNFYENYLIEEDAPSGCFWRNPVRPSAAIELKIKDTITNDSTYFKTFTEASNTYIAIRIKNNNFYYGWIRISTSNDSKSLTIYDAAISKQSNKFIKTGER